MGKQQPPKGVPEVVKRILAGETVPERDIDAFRAECMRGFLAHGYRSWKDADGHDMDDWFIAELQAIQEAHAW